MLDQVVNHIPALETSNPPVYPYLGYCMGNHSLVVVFTSEGHGTGLTDGKVYVALNEGNFRTLKGTVTLSNDPSLSRGGNSYK